MRRPLVMTLVSLVLAVMLCAVLLPTAPTAAQVSPFATNTPRPTAPPVVTPEPPLANYALRLWVEDQLINTIVTEVQQLQPGSTDAVDAIRLLQFELTRRFPNAPTSPERAERLVNAMLGAPLGTVDMRVPVRKLLEFELNRQQPDLDDGETFDFMGFEVEITSAEIDGQAATEDAMLHVTYPLDEANLQYDDYVVAQLGADGFYRVLDSNPPLPAAPIYDMVRIDLLRLQDGNGDITDELALIVERAGMTNRELFIYSYRSGVMVSVIEPGQRAELTSIENWPDEDDDSGGTLALIANTEESGAWGCAPAVQVNFTWTANLFRRTSSDTVNTAGSLACRLEQAGDFFDQPAEQAIEIIEMELAAVPDADPLVMSRAQMTLAMLHTLDGQFSTGREIVNRLAANAEPGTWLASQAEAFLTAATLPGATPLTICAALAEDQPDGACDMDAVLMRLFNEQQPLSADVPLDEQLAAYGIEVSDSETVSEVSEFDTEIVTFELGGERRWAFSPRLDGDVYEAEMIEMESDIPMVSQPMTSDTIFPPSSVYNALLVNDNPRQVLGILDNMRVSNPDAELSLSARYLQAFSLDLLGTRTEARAAYLNLWLEAPGTVWGRLAAAHLERR